MNVYKGAGVKQEQPATFRSVSRHKQTDPAFYRADPHLVSAVNVALLLGQPLLVTGDPGTGKTQLAHAIAWELGFGERAIPFETKSTSSAKDLFYTYDALRRFRDAYDRERKLTELDYIKYNALGEAILKANDRKDVEHLLPATFDHPGEPRKSVVLIDEIDKAPRDFPNDLLSEIEDMFFRIPELENQSAKALDEYRPIVVITSNSEKNLPDAFLRRCVYYHIPFPEADRLREIVALRVDEVVHADDAGVRDAVSLFGLLRAEDTPYRLTKKPATAELIGWINALRGAGANMKLTLKEQPDKVRDTLVSVVKLSGDRPSAQTIVEGWIKS